MMAYPTLLKCPFANMPEKPTTKKCPKYTSTKSELPLERFQNYVTEAPIAWMSISKSSAAPCPK